MKAVCLISGGIDSIVSAYLMKKKEIEIEYLHAEIKPKKEKIKKLIQKIETNPKIHYFDQKKFLTQVVQKCEKKYTCLLCKRNMYKQAEKLAKKINADFIITGESVGQVASQTLKNMNTLNEAVKIPIIRPLIGLNKEEIITIAKKIETYTISIINNPKCDFVPIHPSTNAKIEKLNYEEKKLI